jgi:RNA polymerase sigma-54 factor
MLLQTQTPSLRPLTTAHLAQTMMLLALNSAELRQKIEAALSSNPALELLEEPRCPHCRRRLPAVGPCPMCSAPRGQNGDQPVVFISPRSDFFPYRGRLSEDETPADEWAAEVEDLPTYVLRQIATELAPADRPLAAHILTGLDEDGLLSIPLVEIARYHHVPLSRVQAVQMLIQRAEPVGVASCTPLEAMLAQLDVLAETRPVPALAARAIQEGIDLLSRRAYAELGRMLGIPTAQASRIASFIADNLNPYPGRAHWGDIHLGTGPRPAYQEPDVLITYLHDGPDAPLVVEIVAPYAGALRINPLFRQTLAQAPADKVDQWQNDLDSAMLLVKCLQQRNHTLVRLMQRLASLQRRFIREGDAYLLPITRAQLAIELEVHESTISRAVAGKAVQLPNRKVIPLSKWFDRSLNVRTALLEIIAKEKQPLNDSQIAELLLQQGYDVARRTVAKYRSMEGVLPARLRQPALVGGRDE